MHHPAADLLAIPGVKPSVAQQSLITENAYETAHSSHRHFGNLFHLGMFARGWCMSFSPSHHHQQLIRFFDSTMPNHESPTGSFKRRRTLSLEDSDQGESVGAPVTRSDIWLDDGSVVIQAGFTQFRVHRTMLSRHSTIFKDMFSVAQPGDLDPSIEGCPLVHLSDSPEDIRHILSALYDQYDLLSLIYFNKH